MKKTLTVITVFALLVTARAQSYTTVSTFAGTSNSGLVNGSLATARFDHPYGVCSDSLDNIYVADSYNNCIRKIQNGMVTTVAGNGATGDVDAQGANARFDHPTGVYFKNGYLYICDNLNNKIKRMDAAGNVVTIAGSGVWSFQDGPALQAQFKEPKSLVVDNNNVVYVADYENHCVRKIANGQVTTIAGAGGVAGDQTGAAASARFHRPRDLCIDSQGNIYVVDLMNNKVKVITTGGIVNLVAGSGVQGNADGVGASATFDRPVGIDWFPSGELCVLSSVGPMIRMVTTSGTVTSLAGTGTSGYIDGALASAKFNLPQDICFTSNGDLYVGDDLNNVIRVLTNTDAKGIADNSGLQALSFFPNPSNDQITIRNTTESKLTSISIYDINGKLIKTVPVQDQETTITISIADLAPGQYLVIGESEKARFTGKLIRE